MKFLLDQDVFASTAKFLRELGHDVVTARKVGLSGAEDTELLQGAKDAGRILVTRDRDFGALVFLRNLGAGVIYLRLTPSSVNQTHTRLSSRRTSPARRNPGNPSLHPDPHSLAP